MDDTTDSTEQGVIPRTLSESIYTTRKKVIHVLLFLLGLMLGGLVGITTMCLMQAGRQ